MIRNGALALAVLMAVAFAWAQAPATQPATQPDADRIAALIAQMGNATFQTRQDAQKALVAIGPPAEAALRVAAAHSASAEIRSRATAALDAIEDNLADAPTRVSIQAVKQNPAIVLRSLAEQANAAMVFSQAGEFPGEAGHEPPITLKLDRVPLLVALERYCKAGHSHLAINFGDGSGALQIEMGDSGVWDQEPRVATVASRIGHDHEIDLSNSYVDHRDFVALSFYFDPRLPLVGYQNPDLAVAVDEHGLSLLPTDDDRGPPVNGPPDFGEVHYNRFISPWGFEASLPLHISAQTGATLARLEGMVTFRVVATSEPMNFPDLAKADGGPGITVGQRKVQVLGFDFDGAAANLHLRISKIGPPAAAEYSQDEDLFYEFRTARVVDANGTVIALDGHGAGTPSEIDWHCQFTAPGQRPLKGPFSLHWQVPTQMKEVVVPFKFKNLPLPPG